MNLIAVRKASPDDLPFSKGTIYHWHSKKKHPAMIFKISGKLFFDLDEYEKLAKKAQAENMRQAKRIRAGI